MNDDIYFKFRKLISSFFEDVANVHGWIFEETWDPFYKDGLVICFSNKSNGKHVLRHFDMNTLNALYHLSENTIILDVCLPFVKEAIEYLK